MNESKELKIEMKDKNVVFVYITNVTSPKPLWQKSVPKIAGEHYYLSREQWDYILGQFGFTAIPSYVIYDQQGELQHKETGYPGNEPMKKIIDSLLIQ